MSRMPRVNMSYCPTTTCSKKHHLVLPGGFKSLEVEFKWNTCPKERVLNLKVFIVLPPHVQRSTHLATWNKFKQLNKSDLGTKRATRLNSNPKKHALGLLWQNPRSRSLGSFKSLRSGVFFPHPFFLPLSVTSCLTTNPQQFRFLIRNTCEA